MSDLAIATRDLSKSFGGFRAVDGVDLAVRRRSRHAVIGPNGAGKSTLFNLLTGGIAATAGVVEILGVDVTGKPPFAIARHGVARAFQTTKIFSAFTVLENIQFALLSGRRRNRRMLGSAHKEARAEAGALLSEVGLHHREDEPAGVLSHGDQRSLELAISLALSPSVLILDEPTAGMSPEETRLAMELVRRITEDRQITLLFSEHDMDVVFETADVVTVMAEGKVLAEGSVDEVRRDPQVSEVYFGG